MRTVCAWCQKTIRANCPHCGEQLVPTTVLGASLPFGERDSLTCVSGVTAIVYSQTAILQMQISHGICSNCLTLPETEREKLIALRRQKNHLLPSAADLDKITEEHRIHEATKKRGPTEVTKSATPRAESERKK